MPVRAALLTLILLSAACVSQAAAPPPAPSSDLPPGVFAGERDYRQAPAGTYRLDGQHAGVVARVSHLGYSYSIFRFDTVTGTLTWDPADPAASKLTARVRTGSIATNVPGFARELAGDGFLKSRAFPEATFVSTAFRQTDPDHGKVDGQFTLMGKTVPLTFDVTLVGAGKGFMGHPRLGVHAEGEIRTADFGLAPMLGPTIQLAIDTEFGRQ
jgi:polyisoprenoid-binding protein YceI